MFKWLIKFQTSVKEKTIDRVVIVMIFFFTIAYALLALNRYWQLQYFFVDNVYFQTAFWEVARLQIPIVNHTTMGKINIFGDHFHPVIFIISPLLKLFGRNEITLIVMVVSLSLGMFLAYRVASLLIKNKIIRLALIFASFMYLGTQNSFIFGFHELNLVPLFFWLMVYSFFYKKKWMYVISIVLLFLTKETMALVVFSWGLFLFASQKPSQRRHATIIMIVSCLYFFITTRLIIPHFAGSYLYTSKVSYPTSIGAFWNSLIEPREKITTFIVSITTFGFLPLLNLSALPFVLQDFLTRYLISIKGNVQYTLTYHYGIASVNYLLFSSIWTVHTFEKKKIQQVVYSLFAFIIIIASLYFHRFYNGRGPLQMAFMPDFYKITSDNRFLWELIEHVPKKGTIVTQNHLGFPLSDRQLFEFPRNYDGLSQLKPDYIVYDKRTEQSPANILPFSSFEEFVKYISKLEKDKHYKIYFKKDTLVILKRI